MREASEPASNGVNSYRLSSSMAIEFRQSKKRTAKAEASDVHDAIRLVTVNKGHFRGVFNTCAQFIELKIMVSRAYNTIRLWTEIRE